MILLAQKNTLFTNRFFGAAWSFVSFRSLRRGWLYFGVLSSFPAFLLSGFPAFLISCFPSLRFSCFPAFTFFWCLYTIVQSTLPAPGRGCLPNLPSIFHFFLVSNSILTQISYFPACPAFPVVLLSCFSAALLFCFPVYPGLARSPPYQPAVVQRGSGSSMASFDKASAAWLYSRYMCLMSHLTLFSLRVSPNSQHLS